MSAKLTSLVLLTDDVGRLTEAYEANLRVSRRLLTERQIPMGQTASVTFSFCPSCLGKFAEKCQLCQ